MAEPDIHVLRRMFAYNPDTGHVTWTIYRGSMVPGDIAGYVHSDGYRYIRLGRSAFCAHRIAWILHIGTAIPNGMQIDHENGNRDDNRLQNLRIATATENHWNRATPRTNRSGFKGVTLHKPSGLWAATIKANKVRHHLGYFKTPEAAYTAYRKASLELHGRFSRLD